MKPIEPFLERNKRIISSNQLDYLESNSISTNKKELDKGIEKYIIESVNKSNKKISTSSLQSNKKPYNPNNYIYDEDFKTIKNNIAPNSTKFSINRKRLNYSNSCPILILNNLPIKQNKCYKEENNNEFNNENIYPNINYNIKSFRNKNEYGRNNKLLKKRQFYNNIPFYSNRGIKTFYKTNNFGHLLNKRIKIIKKPQTCEPNKNRKKGEEKNRYEIEFNYRYKKMFDRKLPLNDLRNYKAILFEESRLNQPNSQYYPKVNDDNVFTNKKINSTIKEYDTNKYLVENKDKNDNNNSLPNKSNNLDNTNFETIELHGIITKVMTKLPKTEINNNSENIKQDFHQIMRHPLSIEEFGYKFLRNLDKDYKIFKKPLDDKDLIQKIHHLIINPNTKLFRNGNLMYNSAGFCRKKNLSAQQKNYKELSNRGYKRLKNNEINRFKQDVEDNIQHIEDIKDKLNMLMERNKKIFKEHRKELENEK